MSTNFAYITGPGSRMIDDSAWMASLFSKNGLQSRVLKGDEILGTILHNDNPETINHLINKEINRGEHVLRLEIALKIVIPQMDGVSNSVITRVMGTVTSEVFSQVTQDWILHFQQGFNQTYSVEIANAEVPYKRLEETGILDAPTLLFLDKELSSIKYYDIDQEKVIHNARKAVDVSEFTIVSSENCTFRKSPLDSDVEDSIQLVFNDRVLIHQIIDGKNWCYVELDGGELGYIRTTDIWTDSAMPDTDAKLYKIPVGSGMGLLEIVQNHYTLTTADEALEIDRRFYANLLLFVNNPEGGDTKIRKRLNFETGFYDLDDETPIPSAIVSTEGGTNWKLFAAFLFASPSALLATVMANITWDTYEDFISEEFGTHRDDWKHAHAIGGKLIWIPSANFAHTLREVVNTGSISGNIKEAYGKLNKAIFDKVKPALDNWWTAGRGFRLDVGLGATFLVPLALDGDYYSYIYRDTEGADENLLPENKSYRFKLYRRGIVKGGLDGGVGAGFFAGMRGLGKHGKYISNSKSWGIGGGIGAEGFAGLRFLAQEEFIFDIDESSELAFMLLMTIQPDFFSSLNPSEFSSPVAGFTTPFSTPSMATKILKTFELLQVDPYDYISKYKIEAAVEGSLGAAGSVGLRFGDSEELVHTETWGTRSDNQMPHDRGNWAVPQMVSQILELRMGMTFIGDACLGFKMEFPNGFSEEGDYGFRIPNTVVASGYIDAEIVKQGQISFVQPFINMIPDIGGGVEIQLTITSNASGSSPSSAPTLTLSDPKLFVYAKSGEMDFYNHAPASLVTVSFDPNIQFNGVTPVLPTSINNLFVSSTDPTNLEKRIPLVQFMSNPKFQRFHRYRTKITRLIKHYTKSKEYDTSWGFIGEGWLTFKFTLDQSKFFTLAQNVLADLMNQHGMELKQAAAYLIDVLKGVHTPKIQPIMIQQLIAAFNFVSVTLHVEGGAGAAIAGRLGKGEAKVRLRAGVSFYCIYHTDMTEFFEKHMDEIREIGLFETVIHSVEAAVEQVTDVNTLIDDPSYD